MKKLYVIQDNATAFGESNHNFVLMFVEQILIHFQQSDEKNDQVPSQGFIPKALYFFYNKNFYFHNSFN